VVTYWQTSALCLALGIEVEIFCEATNKRLKRIARPEGERPKYF
jgi:hypothetical protein